MKYAIPSPIIDVVCAIIRHPDHAGVCLVAQRSSKDKNHPLKWEYPGGKLEHGESPEAAIVREIREELDIEISVVQALTPQVHHYPGSSIRLIPFVCDPLSMRVRLAEHAQIQWLQRAALPYLDWALADLPIVEEWLSLP